MMTYKYTEDKAKAKWYTLQKAARILKSYPNGLAEFSRDRLLDIIEWALKTKGDDK